MERLLLLLDSPQGEAHAREVIKTANLSRGQFALILERYSLRFLRSSTLASLVLDMFDGLVAKGYPEKVRVLSACLMPR